MRRIAFIAVTVGILGAVLFLYLQRNRSREEQSEERLVSDRSDTTTSVPRLAVSMPIWDAGWTDRAPTVASQDGGGDADHLALDEQSLMERISANLTRDPGLAEMLAREGRKRFPDSPASDERDMELVLALFNQQKIEFARSEAYHYVVRHPNGRYVEDLAHLAGTKGSRR